MARMVGDVGFDEDIRATLAARSEALDQLSWLALRRALSNGDSAERERLLPRDLANGEQKLIERWLADGCPKRRGRAYRRFFFELDAWSEYWDLYHPETRGLYYFGDGSGSPGHLSAFLPSPDGSRAPAFECWKRFAILRGEMGEAERRARFEAEARKPQVVEAVLAVDALVEGLVREHFRGVDGRIDPLAYLDALERFGADCLPESRDRFERVPQGDFRKSSSLHHTIEGDIMWFCWAAQLECAEVATSAAGQGTARAVMMAGIALGCSMDFALRGRRRTRSEYQAGSAEARWRMWDRSLALLGDFDRAAREVSSLFRIRAYGDSTATASDTSLEPKRQF